MFGGKVRTEQLCLVSWFQNWNDDQKVKFLNSLVEQIHGVTDQDLLLSMDNLGLVTNYDGPDMFSCQMKMFSNWWRGWDINIRTNFLSELGRQNTEFGHQMKLRGLL